MSSSRMLSRRQFVQRGTAAAMVAAIPTWRPWPFAMTSLDHARLAHQAMVVDPSAMRALAHRAVDAARSAGATYADVRVTRIVSHAFSYNQDAVVGCAVGDDEQVGIGVRALVNGYWGFAASPYWDPDEAVQLARTAVSMANANALGTPRRVELGTIPVATGQWTTPIRIDPFAVSIEEKVDFMNAWRVAIEETPVDGVLARPDSSTMTFSRQERCSASTEGMSILQTLYTSQGNFGLAVVPSGWRSQERGEGLRMEANGIEAQGKGWELFLDAKIREQIPGLIEHGKERLALTIRPVQIGRYDAIFDAGTTAALLAQTIGVATQLDRAKGFEANASGTSYLGPDPFTCLGTFRVGAPSLTVTANRSMSGGLATVRWDDEGVVPDEFTIVKNGMLDDYQTTREQAAWLAPWYERQGRPVRSHGCVGASAALMFPLQHIPNLVMTPGASSTSFEDLVAATPRGVAIRYGGAFMDPQARTGRGYGEVYEIVNGKLGVVYGNGAFQFGTTELWNNIVALGGASSAVRSSQAFYKGQPGQWFGSTVSAVPMKVKNLSIIDATR